MTDTAEPIAHLEAHETELVFDSFDQNDAWRLGSLITTNAITAGAGVAIDIRRPGFILFRASLPGTTADQESWVARKAATTLRLEASSALLALRFESVGYDPTQGGWLDPTQYALAGGSFPIRVRGTGVVAAVTASGLSSDDDHALVTDGIREFLASR